MFDFFITLVKDGKRMSMERLLRNMEEITESIVKKAGEILKGKVEYVKKMDQVPSNNSVYNIIVNDKSYIFKIFKQRTWPEDGKLIFVNKQLIENRVGCAKIITFDRNDSHFQTGYLIEEYVSGINAEHIVFDLNSGTDFYEKLALLVSKIHRIHIKNFGYIGNGVAGYASFTDFMSDKYDEITTALVKKHLFDKNSLRELKNPVMDGIRLCESLPPVLNHGDLSTKNVIIGENGKLTLIDWDDAMSYNWIADIARMTYWMKFKYNNYEYELYKNKFMEHYATEAKVDFEAFENIFHVWIGMDHLNFYSDKPQYEKTMEYFKKTLEKL